MELGFLVSGSYKESKDKSEMTFRKALRFVRNMAQKAKVSDSGTHIGLVVYGKKPYLAFDFNQYFEISSLSKAIEEVKTPIAGSNLGEALSFTKNQLYDKSARPNIPKTLIVLLSKRSEDAIGHAVKDLKDAGVKILTVGIGGENDPLEMSDSASDIQNTLISDENHLDTLETKLAPKLCRGKYFYFWINVKQEHVVEISIYSPYLLHLKRFSSFLMISMLEFLSNVHYFLPWNWGPLHYWSKYEHVYKSLFELNVLSTICFSNQ